MRRVRHVGGGTRMRMKTDAQKKTAAAEGGRGLARTFARWRVSRRSGRNAKAPYYLRNFAASLVPGAFWRVQRETLLAALDTHPRREELLARVAYACRLPDHSSLDPAKGGNTLHAVGDERFPRRKHTYFYDARAILRYFPEGLRYRLVPGDVTWVPDAPAFVKSRPVSPGGANANSVLLRLNQVRHFVRVRDPYSWEEKDNTAVFRGKIYLKPKRMRLFERFFGVPGFDLGDTSGERPRPEWIKPQLTIPEQLRHRFILCIEGNDVASCLKWVFASNSLAVMPRPEYETWFEEGRLVPGVHYIEIRPDYADLPGKLAFYAARPDICEIINRAERQWAARFADPVDERLVGLAVACRYFEASGQWPVPRPDTAQPVPALPRTRSWIPWPRKV